MCCGSRQNLVSFVPYWWKERVHSKRRSPINPILLKNTLKKSVIKTLSRWVTLVLKDFVALASFLKGHGIILDPYFALVSSFFCKVRWFPDGHLAPGGDSPGWRWAVGLSTGIFFFGDLHTFVLRRGCSYDVRRKHCTKESGNLALPCHAGVWIRSTRKCFLHLGSRPESSLKRNKDTKDWARFTSASPREAAEEPQWASVSLPSTWLPQVYIYIPPQLEGSALLRHTKSMNGQSMGKKKCCPLPQTSA